MSTRPIEYWSTGAPSDALLAAVDEGLESHNRGAAPRLAEVDRIAAFARDPSGHLIGGAVGRTWGVCCELLQLWVRMECRNGGVGSRLMQEFESAGRARGCRVFYLTTLSFQAPGFYRKHGYVVLAQIDGYPEGIAKYLMHKKEA